MVLKQLLKFIILVYILKMHKSITIKELKTLLNKLPDETELDYLVSRNQFERVLLEDFIYDDINKVLLIKADWN